jgi:hypothetical protein
MGYAEGVSFSRTDAAGATRSRSRTQRSTKKVDPTVVVKFTRVAAVPRLLAMQQKADNCCLQALA